MIKPEPKSSPLNNNPCVFSSLFNNTQTYLHHVTCLSFPPLQDVLAGFLTPSHINYPPIFEVKPKPKSPPLNNNNPCFPPLLNRTSLEGSSHSSPSPMSSTNSSQDSLHKQTKKKGIKSSLGRFFSKKEKAKAKELSGLGGSGLVGTGELAPRQGLYSHLGSPGVAAAAAAAAGGAAADAGRVCACVHATSVLVMVMLLREPRLVLLLWRPVCLVGRKSPEWAYVGRDGFVDII